MPLDINWTTVLVAAFASMATGIPAIIVALHTHSAVNSRMDKMIDLVTEKVTAQATLAEKAAQKQREGVAATATIAAQDARQVRDDQKP